MRRHVLPVLSLVTAVTAAAGCRVAKKSPEEDAPPPVASAAAADPPPKEAARPACPAIDRTKIARFECNAKVVKTPVPPVLDPHDTLAPFYAKLAELARGTRKERLRIGMYGDSNLTSDFMTGHLRRVLQGRFGDAGHGYISLSRPWGSYRHEDVESKGFWPMFKLYAPTTHVVRDKQYGFANMAAESDEIGAAAWAGTTKSEKAKVGKSVTSFDVYYLKQPRGGSFDLMLDRKVVRTVSTRAEKMEAAFEVVEAEDGPHEVRVQVKGDGKVRFFGTSLDRAIPEGGIQIDSLGAGALNFERLGWVASDTRKAQLERRAYDLVIVWLGMNVMFVPPNKGYATSFIGELRAALPSTPILVLTPGDTVKEGQTKSDPRIVAVAKQMREVADETGTAFWDFREAMGGDGSIIGFTKRGLTGQDHIHFGPEGSAFMANRLLCAMFDDLNARVDEKPEMGCPSP